MNKNLSSTWKKNRRAFNHDWLKNRYLPALAKFLNLLDDKIEDSEFESSFVEAWFKDWIQYYKEALSLLKDFNTHMSPKLLFQQVPLVRYDEETKSWLGELTHSLWLSRPSVKNWLGKAFSIFGEANLVYNKLQHKLLGCENKQSVECLRPYQDQFAEFRDFCEELARVIEKYPKGTIGI